MHVGEMLVIFLKETRNETKMASPSYLSNIVLEEPGITAGEARP